MTLAIGDRAISSPEHLSEHLRLALHLVDGGHHWLHWAIHEANETYAFPDESVMAGAVQTGLHGDSLALLPTLKVLVSPIKLMTFGLEDLRLLWDVERGRPVNSDVADPARDILRMHGVRSQEDLQDTLRVLDALLGQPLPPALQVLTLADQIALEGLGWTPPEGAPLGDEIRTEAATFAAEEARTAQEFVDYFQVYLALAARFGAKADTASKRLHHARHARDQLLPALLHAIDCPEVLGLVAPGEVAEAVQIWQGSGRALGFQRISAGLREIVKHTAYRSESGEQARAAVIYYMIGARTLLTLSPPRRGVMGQDGATCRFPIQSREAEGEVELSPSGVISLAWFRPRPRAKHQPQPRTAAAA